GDFTFYRDVSGLGTVITAPKIDLGSQFGIELDAGLAARVGLSMSFGFGFSKKEKFFIDTSADKEVELEVRVGLASSDLNGPASVSGKLGPLVLTASDQYPTATYSSFLMDLNLARYRVPVYNGNTADNSNLSDLTADLNTALKSALPKLGFGTTDVIAQ